MNTIRFFPVKKSIWGFIHSPSGPTTMFDDLVLHNVGVVPKDWYQPGATSEERSVATVFTKDRDTLVT